MTAQHTPGPWAVDRPGWRSLGITVLGSDGVTLQHSSRPLAERQANALIMAAGPGLLEALRQTVAALEHWFFRYDDPEGTNSQMMKNARAAIDDAMGGDQT